MRYVGILFYILEEFKVKAIIKILAAFAKVFGKLGIKFGFIDVSFIWDLIDDFLAPTEPGEEDLEIEISEV